ncbi:MAG TPA: hypothetical protein VKJ07_23685 [Mycobacteriales bacterium]|nr:hypothetical protein [Mycobacteriales bacterium]
MRRLGFLGVGIGNGDADKPHFAAKRHHVDALNRNAALLSSRPN